MQMEALQVILNGIFSEEALEEGFFLLLLII